MGITHTKSIFRYIIYVSLLALLFGCGGGGGGTDPGNNNGGDNGLGGESKTIAGDFVHLVYNTGYDNEDGVYGYTGFAMLDIANDGSYVQNEQIFSDDDDPNEDSGTVSFSIMSDGTLAVKPSETGVLRGALSLDEDYMVFTSFSSSEELGLDFMMLTSSGMNNASMTGTYMSFGYKKNQSNQSLVGCARLVFNGDGTMTWQRIFSSSQGTIVEDPKPFTYDLDGNGVFHMKNNGVEVARGVVKGDGQFGSYVDLYPQAPPVDDGLIGIGFFVKESSGKTLASLSGDFFLEAFETQVASLTPRTYLYSSTFDGNGTMTGTGLYDSGNSSHVGDTFSNSYSVSDNGQFTISADTRTLPGIVSSDGRFIVFIVPDTHYSEVQLFVGIKRP